MRILIVDDHPMVIAGCRTMLAGEADAEIVEARDAKEALDLHARLHPDVTALDLNLPDMDGHELLRRILKRKPGARVLVYTMNADPVHAARAIELGALGFMSKTEDPARFVAALKMVAAGERYVSEEMARTLAFYKPRPAPDSLAELTPRERDMLRLLADGRGLAEIAHDIGVSYKSVANGCALLNHKLAARSRADLIRIAVEAKAAGKLG